MLPHLGPRIRSALRQANSRRWGRGQSSHRHSGTPTTPQQFSSSATQPHADHGIPTPPFLDARNSRHRLQQRTFSSAAAEGTPRGFPEPHIPGFFESLKESLSDRDGQVFAVGVIALAAAGYYGERFFSDSHGHGHHAPSHKPHEEAEPADGVEIVEVVLEEKPVTVLEAAQEASLETADLVGEAVEAVVGAVGEVVEAVGEKAAEVGAAVGDKVAHVIGDGAGEAGAKLGESLGEGAALVQQKAEEVAAAVEETVREAAAVIQETAEALEKAVGEIREGVQDGLKEVEEGGAGKVVEEKAEEAVASLDAEAGSLLGEGGSKGGEEKEEDCPFCKFMRAGPCGAQFTAWEDCVDAAAKEEMVEKCMEATHELKLCMEGNPEYYGVILEAEKSLLEREAKEGGSTAGEGAAEGGEVLLETVVTETEEAVAAPELKKAEE